MDCGDPSLLNDATLNISIGKSWQSSRGSLVFQCSVFDGRTRQKGYIEISSFRQDPPVSFKPEKPESLLAQGGIAMLVRKHMSSGVISALAMNEQSPEHGFIRLEITGKSADGTPNRLWIIISHQPEPELTIITGGSSIARLRESAQYTSRKDPPQHFLSLQNVPTEGFQAWLRSIISTAPDQIKSMALSTEGVLPLYQRTARDRVARRLKTIKKTLAQDARKIPDETELSAAKLEAKLLRDYMWLVQPNTHELKLDATQTGESRRVISLNPDISPGANLEGKFKQIKKIERALELGAPRVQTLKKDLTALESALVRLRTETNLSERDVNLLLEQVGLEVSSNHSTPGTTKSARDSSPRGRRFMTSSGELILLGRNAEESDQIVKTAKSQTWWIHVAGGGHGSHVIMPDKAFREGIPSHALREAGILAIHFSDRAHSREGEVYVARRHQIRKRKGMPPGLWQIDRAETVMIRYEPEELAAIFAREQRS